MDELRKEFLLQIADNAMIIGNRLSEWCGHGPVLEQDIALTNLALDEIGLAKNIYAHLAELEGGNLTEDSYPYLRDTREWKNVLLVERPNGHFGHTILRQFLYDTFNFELLSVLSKSSDTQISAIAAKSLKETRYHLKYSTNWMMRLGDGTEESHQKMVEAIDDLCMYYGEFFIASKADTYMAEKLDLNLAEIKERCDDQVKMVLREATLEWPEDIFMQRGGKQGIHTEHLGFILTDMQFLQKTYPNQTW